MAYERLRRARRSVGLLFLALLLLLGCGGDDSHDEGPCTPLTEQGCEPGQVCEEVMGGEPACFAPIVVKGRVLDMHSGDGISGATLVALDVNNSARSSVVTSGADGAYSIAVPVTRVQDGGPVVDAITLRVSAAGYHSFPTPPREALPIDLDEAAAETDGERVVKNPSTDVVLAAISGDTAGFGSIAGSVDHDLGSGALVVAVQDEVAVSTAIADRAGAFVLFNVPAGETTVEAYRSGLRVEPALATVAPGARIDGLTLAASTEPLAAVTGSVSIVNATGGLTTSVILVLESTFSQQGAVVRGLAPAGLRAGEVSGAFRIEAVPPGKYAVLAAFENDGLVRDPDESISGTDVVHIEVSASGDEVALPQSFKVTEALAIESPGADGLELLAAGTLPKFVWADDSSEDGYELRVFDSLGTLVHEALDIPRVSGGEHVEYTWNDAEVEPGAIYQFRVWSWRMKHGTAARTYVSASEDLRGTFQMGIEP
jgi:hypothetical protein